MLIKLMEKNDRFWSKVKLPDFIGTDECWEWQSAKDKDGYGKFWLNRKYQQAHRVSYQLCVGLIPDGLYVLHNCSLGDNSSCVNPAHLWLGTTVDNTHDRNKKGRTAKGEKQGSSKLTSSQVIQIRSELANKNKNQTELAKEFGVCCATINNIFHKVIWKHVV